jgi:hypothetical protein
MRRVVEPPVTSSTPRPSDPRNREHAHPPSAAASDNVPLVTLRTTNDSAQSQSIAFRRKSLALSTLAPLPAPGDVTTAPSGRKSPAYLQGKNPYGQIFEKNRRPCREPKSGANGPPSQAGSSTKGRPRTSGAFKFKTRPMQLEPERTTLPLAPQLPPLPYRQSQKPVSVKSAKNFFETKASESRSRTPLSPSTTQSVGKGASADPHVEEESTQVVSWVSKNSEARRDLREESELRLPIPQPPSDAVRHGNCAQRTNPFGRQNTGTGLDRRIGAYIRKYQESVEPKKVTATSCNHDGSSTYNSLSPQSLASATLPMADVGVGGGYYDIKVPDDVDYRASYGRRSTKDFSFHGGRIELQKTHISPVQLQHPSGWPKRSCSHFPGIETDGQREDAAQQQCRECMMEKNPESRLEPERRSMPRSAHRRAATDSSTGATSSNNDLDACFLPSRRRRQHSEYIPNDRCGNTFAEDLDYLIDAIIEEHTNSLNHVISNIRSGKPRLGQLRKVSQDLVRQCQPKTYHTTCVRSSHEPCRHREVRRPIRQPDSRPSQQACKHEPHPYPCISPRAAEKLNVEGPGQVEPNMNDSLSSLTATTHSIPDLINLVNSAADNLGVDLDDRPTTQEDERFENAPVEKTSQQSVNDAAVEDDAEDDKPTEDQWLQKNRRQSKEFSKARSQSARQPTQRATQSFELMLETEEEDPVLEPKDSGFEPPLSRVRGVSRQPSALLPEPEAAQESYEAHVVSRQATQRPTWENLEIVGIFDLPKNTPPIFRGRTGSLRPLGKAVTEALADFATSSPARRPTPELEHVEVV